MENKTFMFATSWAEPLRKLTPEQRWNVVEAIMEYSLTGSTSIKFSLLEDMAFTFIRGDLDRMLNKYNSVCDKRREAANARWKGKATTSEPENETTCKSTKCTNSHYKEETNTETDTETETKPKKKSSSSGARARRNAVNEPPYDDSKLLESFFDSTNQATLEALAMRHRLPISELREIAQDIVIQWALSNKTHETYQDASLHLQYVLAEKVSKERDRRLKNIAETKPHSTEAKGILGVDEYRDEQGRRTYNGIDFIPNDAPPRPGKAYWWNHTTLSWDDNI